MECPTGKRGYPSKASLQRELKAKRRRGHRRGPKPLPYQCRFCERWHIMSADCRRCGSPIVWAETPGGMNPLDRRLVPFETPKCLAFDPATGRAVGVRDVERRDPAAREAWEHEGRTFHTSHISTCSKRGEGPI